MICKHVGKLPEDCGLLDGRVSDQLPPSISVLIEMASLPLIDNILEHPDPERTSEGED